MRLAGIVFTCMLSVFFVTACGIQNDDPVTDPETTDTIDYPENERSTQSSNTYNVDSTMSTVGPDNASPMVDSMPAK